MYIASFKFLVSESKFCGFSDNFVKHLEQVVDACACYINELFLL